MAANGFTYRKKPARSWTDNFLFRTLKTAGKSVNGWPGAFGALFQVPTTAHCLAEKFVLISFARWRYFTLRA